MFLDAFRPFILPRAAADMLRIFPEEEGVHIAPWPSFPLVGAIERGPRWKGGIDFCVNLNGLTSSSPLVEPFFLPTHVQRDLQGGCNSVYSHCVQEFWDMLRRFHDAYRKRRGHGVEVLLEVLM